MATKDSGIKELVVGGEKKKGRMSVKHGKGARSKVEVVDADDITRIKEGLRSAYNEVIDCMENPDFRCPKCGLNFRVEIQCEHCHNVFMPFNPYHKVNAIKALAPLSTRMTQMLEADARIVEIEHNAEQCKSFLNVVIDSIRDNVKDVAVRKRILDNIREYAESVGKADG
jgi:hypothetical protein